MQKAARHPMCGYEIGFDESSSGCVVHRQAALQAKNQHQLQHQVASAVSGSTFGKISKIIVIKRQPGIVLSIDDKSGPADQSPLCIHLHHVSNEVVQILT